MQGNPHKLTVIDGETLMDKRLPPAKFCVESLIPRGLCILGGAPKVGKSWFVLDLCVHIARGEPLWEFPVTKGEVLYFCLEDSERRIQERLNIVTDDVPSGLYFATGNTSIESGLCDFIRKFKQEHPDEVVLLLGNHEVHYTEDRAPIGSRFDLELAWQIEEILTENKDLFQCAYSQWGILFTHAGVSDVWFRQSFEGDADGDIASQLHARATDKVLYHCGASRRGPYPHGGIYWAGKSEMQCPLLGTTQVVGHTRTDGVERIESGEGVVYFCDCLEKGKYLMIDNASIPKFYAMDIDNEEKMLL